MTFQFSQPTTVKLMHVNLRDEKHGDEPAAAIDVKFKRESGNDILDLFHPKLLEALYYRDATTEAQSEVPGVARILPNKLFTRMDPISWSLDITGATVVIDFGLGGESNITLHDCKVNSFLIDPKEGGTVEVSFRVQTSKIPDGALDKLAKKLKCETQITIAVPDVKPGPQQQAIDGTAANFEAETKGRKGRKGKDDADPSGGGEPWPFPQDGGQANGDDPTLAAMKDAHGVKDPA